MPPRFFRKISTRGGKREKISVRRSMNTIGSETLESEAKYWHAERDQVVCVYLNYFIKSCITLIMK